MSTEQQHINKILNLKKFSNSIFFTTKYNRNLLEVCNRFRIYSKL